MGSNDAFLTEGKNGFSFPQKSPDQIAVAMLRIEKMSDTELLKMGKVSHQKGSVINTQNWVQTVLEILNFRT